MARNLSNGHTAEFSTRQNCHILANSEDKTKKIRTSIHGDNVVVMAGNTRYWANFDLLFATRYFVLQFQGLRNDMPNWEKKLVIFLSMAPCR